MDASRHGCEGSRAGILLGGAGTDHAAARQAFLGRLEELRIVPCVEYEECAGCAECGEVGGDAFRFRLRASFADDWTPHCDTLRLCGTLGLDTCGSAVDLEREILLAMLAGPISFVFPSFEELMAAVSIRKNIIEAARKTELAFHCSAAERPSDYWTYVKGRGFTLLPGKSLIAGLEKATQPDASGTRYAFSCYRATEYVILLGVARQLALCNPELYERLQHHWESRAIMSGEFHEVFLREHGSMGNPLPLRYYVPGDRVWFRNPDAHSSDVTGYEGSWVVYLGNGLFNNFWKSGEPYTLTSKCVEIYHWRDGAVRGEAGALQMDESIVEQCVKESLSDPARTQNILGQMLRHREPSGMYGNGGCVDTTREYLRWVCEETSDLRLPAH